MSMSSGLGSHLCVNGCIFCSSVWPRKRCRTCAQSIIVFDKNMSLQTYSYQRWTFINHLMHWCTAQDWPPDARMSTLTFMCINMYIMHTCVFGYDTWSMYVYILTYTTDNAHKAHMNLSGQAHTQEHVCTTVYVSTRFTQRNPTSRRPSSLNFSPLSLSVGFREQARRELVECLDSVSRIRWNPHPSKKP